MSSETLTLLFNYGMPTVIIALGLIYGVPYATKKLDEVLDDHRKLVADLVAQNQAQLVNNEAQRKQHLEAERQQRAEYLAAQQAISDKQMIALAELLRLAQDTNTTIVGIRDDWRTWNGIERRRRKTNGGNTGA